MSPTPTLIFIPGAWHRPSCYDKVIKSLQDDHNIKCVAITLPSTTGDPNATFKDDIDAARTAITTETTQGRDVITIAHSYGGMVGNSAIKGLTRPSTSSNTTPPTTGHVTALILIASGFTITGLSFMGPFLGRPLHFFRIDRPSGFAILTNDPSPQQLFYHDLPADEADYWTSQLTTQSLKSLFEGGEHAYAGWRDVPTWYIGTVQDKGLPVMVQRLQVGWARGQGGLVTHVEFESGHSPFLSRVEGVVGVLVEVVRTVSGEREGTGRGGEVMMAEGKKGKGLEAPAVRLMAPGSWLRFGVPYAFGRVLGWGFWGFFKLRQFWRRT